MYKYLIPFNEYKTDGVTGLVEVKMTEIKDLVSNFDEYVFHWDIKDDGILHAYLSVDEYKLGNSYIGEMNVGEGYVKENGNRRDIKSVEEGLDIIEKGIQGILGVSESGQYDSSISGLSVHNIEGKIIATQKHFDTEGGSPPYSAEQMNNIISELEDVLRPFDKIVSEFIVDKLLFDIHTDRLSDEIIKLGDEIMSRYGTEPRQVMEAFDAAFNKLSGYVDYMAHLDEEGDVEDDVELPEGDVEEDDDVDEFGNSIDFGD